MTQPKTPASFKHIEQKTRFRLFELFVWARLSVVPVILSVAAWIALNDHVLWRHIILGIVITSLTTISVVDFVQFRKYRQVTRRAITRNVIGAGTATLVIILTTGALESPFLPVILMVALYTTVFIGPKFGRTIVLVLQLPALWCFAFISLYELIPNVIPDVFGGGSRDGSDDMLLWATAGIYTFVLLGIISFGARMRNAFTSLVKATFDERDEALRINAETNKTLTKLSGEIAHELKNPLASVKGLSALIAKNLDGSAAERMTVLRREVDRMQSILQEFLNFSRPLVPLSQEKTDLVSICKDVADLHEGMAREHSVSINVRSEYDVPLSCDPRKIKQILINLIQNAIEASPESSTITIRVDQAGDNARATIIDQGPGLSKELEERAFEAGITDKASGTGLGLTVARMLARQHGGELKLENSEKGGCEAELVLPRKQEDI